VRLSSEEGRHKEDGYEDDEEVVHVAEGVMAKVGSRC